MQCHPGFWLSCILGGRSKLCMVCIWFMSSDFNEAIGSWGMIHFPYPNGGKWYLTPADWYDWYDWYDCRFTEPSGQSQTRFLTADCRCEFFHPGWPQKPNESCSEDFSLGEIWGNSFWFPTEISRNFQSLKQTQFPPIWGEVGSVGVY